MKTETDKCLQCPIAGICNSNIAEADVPEKIRIKAVVLTLIVPLALMLAIFAALWITTHSELRSAIAALAAPGAYYLAFYFYRWLHCR